MPRPGKPRGKMNMVFDPEVQKAQATLMVARRINGESLESIGKSFNVHPDTVARRIDLAKREGLLANATDRVLNELLPKAVEVFMQHLVEGNYDAAKDILFGTGILSKQNKATVNPQEHADMTLAVWRQERQKRLSNEHVETVETSGRALIPSGNPEGFRRLSEIAQGIGEGADEDGLDGEPAVEGEVIDGNVEAD